MSADVSLNTERNSLPNSLAKPIEEATDLLEAARLSLQKVKISEISFHSFTHLLHDIMKVGDLEKSGKLEKLTAVNSKLLKLKNETLQLMEPILEETCGDSPWCKNRIEVIKAHAQQSGDTTLLKIIQVAEELDLHVESSKLAKGPIFELMHPSWRDSCEVTAFAIGRVFSEVSPELFMDILQFNDQIGKKISTSTALLRNQLQKAQQNIFVCGFQGPRDHDDKGTHFSAVDHWVVIEEKMVGQEFKYRLFFSYIGTFDLRQYLALQPLETEKSIWLSHAELQKVLNAVDEFINKSISWTPEMTAKYLDLFGAGLQKREKENLSCSKISSKVHVININELRAKTQAAAPSKRNVLLLLSVVVIGLFVSIWGEG